MLHDAHFQEYILQVVKVYEICRKVLDLPGLGVANRIPKSKSRLAFFFGFTVSAHITAGSDFFTLRTKPHLKSLP